MIGARSPPVLPDLLIVPSAHSLDVLGVDCRDDLLLVLSHLDLLLPAMKIAAKTSLPASKLELVIGCQDSDRKAVDVNVCKDYLRPSNGGKVGGISGNSGNPVLSSCQVHSRLVFTHAP